MGKLLKEAAVDDSFNAQVKKIQGAIDKLNEIVDVMKKPGSMTLPVDSQRTSIFRAAKDLEILHRRLG